MLKAVLFDLDGTLIDSAPIITQTIATTMRELSGIDLPEESLRKYVGPPLASSFIDLGVPEEEVAHFVASYRQRYNQAFYGTPVFPGIPQMLDEVSDTGLSVGLATSKLHDVAQKVCDALDLSEHFDLLRGAKREDVHVGKHAVVGSALNGLAEAGIIQDGAQPTAGASSRTIREDVVMVGDRIFDINGAGAHGVRTILVTWGDSWPEEQNQAWNVVHTPEELVELLRDVKINGWD